MRSSVPSLCRLVAGTAAVCALLISLLQGHSLAASSSTPPSSAGLGKRWVKIDLADAASTVQPNPPFELSVAIGGIVQGSAPVVAICESSAFQRQMVMLEPDERPLVMKGLLPLEPVPSGAVSVPSNVARVVVTFARLKGDRLERMLSREVVLVLGEAPTRISESSAVREVTGSATTSHGEEQPDVAPMAGGVVAEEELVTSPLPKAGRGYWQQVSEQVSRSWSRTVRQISSASPGGTVRVQFRLYPTGQVQLIQIEQASGMRDVDDAGVQAIVQAQPFPSFSEEVSSEAVDVHVRLRTGHKASSRDIQSVAIQSPSSPSSGAGPKK